ncbi:hypothetical protein DRJ17_01190 [Candidatus Woesearchaeota archaeon]|nr:MAG: hypothetical protein DRJ17_01190 [Candidatus Woesearchaeota archaeon]
MRYKAYSAIIGRKKRTEEQRAKDDDNRPVFVHLFDVHDPHKTTEVPKEMLDFNVHRVKIHGLDVNYLPAGNDILINRLKWIEVGTEEKEPKHLLIKGEQIPIGQKSEEK